MEWRRIFLTSLVCFFLYAASAQQLSQGYINACNDFFKYLRTEMRCGKLDCTTVISWEDWENGARPGMTPGKSTYYMYGGPCYRSKIDSITFSPAELQYIMDAFATQAFADWDAGNILDSITFFPRKYVDSIVKIDKEREPGAWKHGDFFNKHFSSCRGVFEISHPVFLRKNTVCIFYWSVAGSGDAMGIYVKTKKGWGQFTELFHSIID